MCIRLSLCLSVSVCLSPSPSLSFSLSYTHTYTHTQSLVQQWKFWYTFGGIPTLEIILFISHLWVDL
jgi:hypothetical protein